MGSKGFVGEEGSKLGKDIRVRMSRGGLSYGCAFSSTWGCVFKEKKNKSIGCIYLSKVHLGMFFFISSNSYRF